MEIDSIEQEHRDNIFKIMELCGCDIAEAFELYNNNGLNVEKAVQSKFNNTGYYSSPSKSSAKKQNQVNNFDSHDSFGQRDSIDEQENYQKFKAFKQKGDKFKNKYEIRRQSSGIVRGVLSFFKTQQNSFKKRLEDYIGKRINLNLLSGSLSEALQQNSKDKFPFIVHSLNFTKDSKYLNNIKKIYANEVLFKTFDQQYQNYGVVSNEYNLEPFMKQFINLEVDVNALIILRINVFDQIMLLSKISLANVTPEEIKKKTFKNQA